MKKPKQPHKTYLLRISAVLCLLLSYLWIAPSQVHALPAGFQEYYVLGNEEQTYNMFDHIDTMEGGADMITSDQMRSVVTVVATADNQVFYYDHWEDGYEADIFNPTQDSTEIHGDDDPSNGGSDPDILGVGDIISLKSDGSGSGINDVVVVNTRDSAEIRYDGRDYLVSTGGPVDLAHAIWPTDTTWIGGAWEVYSLQAWAHSFSYRIPVGVDSGFGDFVYVWLQVEALYDNTTVTIDNGTDSATVNLDKGQTYSSMGYIDSQVSTPITINEGTTVSSDKQTQVGLITGGHVEFQTRFFVMIPDLIWGTEYIAAIPRTTNNGETEIYLYNPNDYSIIVETHDTSGDDFVTIAAGDVVPYSQQVGYVPKYSAVRLNSEDVFWGLACADTSSDNYDWGFSLIPTLFLMEDYYVSWAPGNLDSTDNASPAWVAPVADNTTFYVDYGPVDGQVDETFTIDAMDTRRIFDPDNDNAGMHIWATNKFVPIWGIDPASGAAGEGYLDLGYTILPLYQGWLDPVLALEKTSDTEILPVEGGTATFTLQAKTHGPGPVTNVDITDTLPISWTYVAGSTIVTYPDGSKGYPEPASNGQDLFWDLSHEMNAYQTLSLQFDAQIQTGGTVGATRWDGFEDGPDYSGGTGDWASDWDENGDNDNPASGEVRIIGSEGVDPYAGSGQLRLRDDYVSIERSVNLGQFARPMLRFKRNAYSLENNEHFYLDVHDGSSWHTGVITWTDGSEEGTWMQEEIDLSTYAATTATIRFRSPNESKSDWDRLYIDEVEIYDAVIVNENQGQAVGEYRGHVFNATDNAVVYVSALNIDKAVDRSTAGIGDTIEYTLSYENSGAITTTGTYINDTVPWGTTFSDASSGGVYISATDTISWTLSDVGPSETSLVTFTVTVDNETPDGTVIENFGRINSDQTGQANSNVVETTVLAPDLDVTKSGPGNAGEGDLITYTIQYANNGGAAATGVAISDSIPVSTTYQAGSMEINTGSGWVSLSDASDADAGTYISGTGMITVLPGVVSGTVAAGESGTIRFSAQIDSDLPDNTTILNYATFDRDGANPQNTSLVATPISDLTIEKAADQTVAVAGDVIEYTLTYGNHGAITETNVYIYDTIPAPSTYVSGTATSAGLTIEYSVDHRGTWTTTVPTDPSQVTDLRWSRDELVTGATGTAGFHVQLPEELPGDTTLSNFATITSTQSGPIYSNILDITTVDLVINKVASSSYAFPGDTVTYTITYGNNGSANTTGVTIADTVPLSATYVEGSIMGAGADDSGAPNLVWNVGTVPAGAGGLQASFAVTLDKGMAPGTDIVNTATISSDLDSATSNESKVTAASAGVTIGPNNEQWSDPGQTLYYAHSIVNTGNVSDTVEITFTHSLWPTATTTLYHDEDGDGAYDSGEPVITTTTGVLEASEEYDILLKLIVPGEASGCDVNQTTITATSTISPSLSSSAVDTTRISCVTMDFSSDSYSVNEDAGTATITVTLDAASSLTVTVDYATSDGTAMAGSDYMAISGTLTFTPGVTTQTFTVSITNDSLYENDETVSLALSNPGNAALGSNNPATLTIQDNDSAPTVSFSATYNVGEGDGTAVITVTLSGASGVTATVDYATSDGTATAGEDYTAATGTLTFTPGTTVQTFTVDITNDVLYENDETISLMLSDPVSATLGTSSATLTISDDDPAPTVDFSGSYSVGEGDGMAVITVTLGAASGLTATVDYATSDGTATAGSDYIAASGTLTFAPGITTQTFTVSITNDALYENDETISLTLSNPVSATLGTPSAMLTITDEDPAPTVDFSATYSVGEGDGTAVITVTLSAASGLTATVDYATSDGTATAGEDYSAAGGTLTFTPGTTVQTFTVSITNDALYENDETVSLTLSNPVSVTLGTSSATLTITDDDPAPTVAFSSASYSVDEDAGTAVITVTLSAASEVTATVDYTTSDGTATAGEDYTAASGTLTFTPGITTQTFTVSITNDALYEDDETVLLTLSDPVSATLGTSSATLTIEEDDSAPTVTFSSGSYSVGEGDGTAVITVTLSAASGLTATVDYATSDGTATAGSDYTATSGTLTFVPGTTVQTFTVDITNDTLDEYDESVDLTLSDPSNATVVGTNPATLTIEDNDDPPAISINDVAVTEGDVGTTNAVFTVTLSAASGKAIIVWYATADGTAKAGDDYTAISTTTLNFPAGTTVQTLTVQVKGDTLDEGDETFFLNLSNPTNATIADGQGVGTITDDDDLPTISISDATVTEGDAGTTDAIFTVTLSAASAELITVDYATADGTAIAGDDYTAISTTTLNFPAGTTVQTITVQVKGDTLDEGDETFFVNLSNPTNATIADGQGIGTITDDDGAPTISISDVTVTEGDAGTTNAVFTVTLSAASGKAITVDYATADGTATEGDDYTAISTTTLSFPAGTTAQTTTVQVMGDTQDEGDETFFVNLDNPTDATVADGQGVGTITDDDAPGPQTGGVYLPIILCNY